MTAEIDRLQKAYDRAKERLLTAQERALRECEQAYHELREAQIAAEGCDITGFTVNYCQTCGRDEAEVHKCPHWQLKHGRPFPLSTMEQDAVDEINQALRAGHINLDQGEAE